MKYQFISVIHKLKLEQPECRIPLASGMITNKSSLIKDFLSYDSTLALHTLGMHSIDEFQNATYYLVEGNFEQSRTKGDIDRCGTQIAFAFLRQIQAITDELWHIRDNAVYVRDGFLFVYDKHIDDGVTFKGSLSRINTMASLSHETVCFSKEDILSASKELEHISLSEIFENKANYSNATQHQYFKNASIGQKIHAWMHILFARSSAAIPIKMLMYVTAMEAMVSTSPIELSHQVSERVALLLGNTIEEREQVYKNIKKAYGYRSKVAHGEPLKGSESDLSLLLVEIDNYLRRLMQQDYPYNSENKEKDDFFLKMILAK